MLSLGLLLKKMGVPMGEHDGEALDLLQDALARMRTAFGEEHPLTRRAFDEVEQLSLCG